VTSAAPGDCFTFPAQNETVVVTGLGDGLAVPAWLETGTVSVMRKLLSSDQTIDWAFLIVNGTDVSHPVNVSNGDELQVRMCASSSWDTTREVTLRYDSVFDTVAMTTVLATYEIDVNITGESGSRRRQLLASESTTDDISIERMVVYGVTNEAIPSSFLEFVFEDVVVTGSATRAQNVQKFKTLSDVGAAKITFAVEDTVNSFRLFSIRSSMEIASVDIDIDDSAAPKTLEFGRQRWAGVEQPKTPP
jgi:hypothetical protein